MDNNINRNIIQAIVQKAFRHLQEEPGREIRNLVDLGSMFVKGKYQKQFFSVAESELEKENSLYYKIVAQIIEKTNEDALLNFGMNLGYNALTCGAKKIRKFETEAGYNVPWVLLLELSESGKFGSKSIDSLINQGKSMGIYSYIFVLQPGYSKLHALTSILAEHDDCAFVLLAKADSFTMNDMISKLSNLKNIMLGLDINTNDYSEIQEIAKLFRTSKLLCSAFYVADNEDYVSIGKATQRAADFGFELVFIVQNYSFYVEHSEETKKMVDYLRTYLDIPVLPFDLLSDIVMVDRSISTEGCLAIVLENGEFYITNMETGEQKSGYNLINTPLCDILSHALPKKTDR